MALQQRIKVNALCQHTIIQAMSSAPFQMELLVVEDDEKLSRSIVRFLSRHGFGVHLVQTKADALELLEDGSPKAVILDVHLPDGSGLEVLEHMRRKGTVIPVVVMTADDSLSVRQWAERLGVVAFLIKPAQPLELLRILEQVLRRAL
jgi:DNA-binding response OmpR family regulator